MFILISSVQIFNLKQFALLKRDPTQNVQPDYDKTFNIESTYDMMKNDINFIYHRQELVF